jgi:hypothetical protein
MTPVLGSRDLLESRLASVERAVADLESRLRTLELGLPRRAPAAVDTIQAPAVAHRATTDVVGVLTLIGRTFLIIAGAYLLRAQTEAGTLSVGVGASLGWAYAMAWTAIAYHAAARQRASATFFGAVTVLIGMPLVWEAATRHALLTPAAGAVALAVTAGLVLLTAWRRNLHALAWTVTVAACVFGTLLLAMTGAVVAFATFFIGLGVATLWLGYEREWAYPRWVTAFFADLTVLALAVRAVATPPRDRPSHALAVQLFLLAGYLGSIGIRTLVRGRDVIAFEVVQTGAALLVALGGALLVAHQSGIGVVPLGSALLVLAAGCYTVEFIDRRQTRGANRYFYTSLALVFALTGGELVADGAGLPLLWSTFGLLAGAAARLSGRTTLAVHAVAYLSAAIMSSGLAATTAVALFAPADPARRLVSPAEWAVLAVLGACWLELGRSGYGGLTRVAHVLRLGLAPAIALGVAGVSLVTARSLLLPDVAAPADAGVVATLRTGVLALSALAVAWLGRHVSTQEFGVLMYPVLAWGALKLFVEDLRTSPPLLLVIAFALYGGALVVAPRIGRASSA